MLKQVASGVIIVFITGVISWMCFTLISLDKTSAVIKTIKTLWEDFIKRKTANDYSSITDK